MAVEGSMIHTMFLDWMEFDMVSAITKLSGCCIYITIAAKILCIFWPVKCSCMDNASIHHGEEVEELLECHGMFQWHMTSI
jgi:hypothetical protein